MKNNFMVTLSSSRIWQTTAHASALAIMTYGFASLSTLPADEWIQRQKGGHYQFLTIQGLVVALLTMAAALVTDFLPSLILLKAIKRALFMIAMPLAVVISSVYWTLLAFMPHLILRPDPATTVPTSSSTVPSFQRIPLRMDLALHAAPAMSLLVDFLLFERKYPKSQARYGATVIAAIAGLWYACWVEHCAQYNGVFPYPFLTYSSFNVRIMIYAGASTLALVSFWMLNALHP
ncbi:hypothetical protein CERSUDRAFT_113609 [Gelatoporia subvermispora B]|uniref:FAR-17a/AIG1-like protein n=1 Tax=Ceriporiopsis subvermispora (strain B) TaxID=914234 RepID=M2R1R8_CERS8|nr:hypothetical protein CERSUDRAFT_113609 [Gelatoporia subvermispora B]